MQDEALWQRIAAHPLDAPTGTAPYSVKLAQAEGWDKAYTMQVIEEYRRFVYLTQINPEQATPSAHVDRAWHMHLTFTRDYWEVLCPKVLGKPLHHEPCTGDEDMPRYWRQYAATKLLYAREFGGPPNPAIWPDKTDWRAVLTGFAVGLAGVGLLFYFLATERPEPLSFHVIAALLIVAGWSYAVFKMPDQHRKAGVSVSTASGCGGGAGCGGGCGGCGG